MSKPEQRSLVPTLRSGAKAMAIVPTTFDDAYRLAQCAAASGTVPSGHDQTAEAITMVVLYGLELGISPIQSIQGITKINGKFCIYGDLVPALLWSHGFDIDQTIEGEGDNMKAVCTITRPNGKKVTRTFSVAQAKVAGLWGKAGPWKQFPERMLGWRALGFAKSDGAADVMRGMSIVEVEQDVTPLGTDKSPVLAVPTDIDDGLPAEATTTEPTTEAEGNQDGPLPNPEQYLAHLETQLKEAESRDEFVEIWAAHQELEARLSDDNRAVAVNLHAEQAKRFEPELDLAPPADKKKGKK